MTRDPVKYKDPETFNPNHFLTAEGRLTDDDMTYAFGFGRRSVIFQLMRDASDYSFRY